MARLLFGFGFGFGLAACFLPDSVMLCVGGCAAGSARPAKGASAEKLELHPLGGGRGRGERSSVRPRFYTHTHPP
jgi:hypothetical protein